VRSARERRRWSDLLRAGGVFLGESFMTVASSREPPPPAPAWVTAAQRRQAKLEGLKRTA
jgi:hypothetical protein